MISSTAGRIAASSSSLECVPTSHLDWLSFVEGCGADATPFHHPAWTQMLGDCYGLETEAVVVRTGGAVSGGIPVVRAPRIRRSTRLVSLPFTDHCPPIGLDGAEAATRFLASAVDQRAQAEVRSAIPGQPGAIVGLRHVLPLIDDEETLRRGFRETTRRRVRKAERDALLEARRVSSLADVLDRFYPLHVQTRRRLGVPVQPKRFFRLLWERMLEPGFGWGLLAHRANVPVAGVILLAYGGSVVYKFGASNVEAQRTGANYLLFWEAIKEACDRRFREFDFGRTDPWNSGLRQFKSGWSATEEALVYTRVNAGGDSSAAGPGTASRLLGATLRHSPALLTRGLGEALYRFTA